MKKIINIILLLLITIPVTEIEYKNAFTQTRTSYSAPLEDGSNYLSNVTIEGINFEFKSEIINYIIDVPYSKKELELSYTKADESAIVEVVGSNDLKIGENHIVLIVTNNAGSAREYSFTINRSDDKVNVINDEMAIQDGIESSESSTIVVELTKEGSKINEETIKSFKDSGKTIIYEWKSAEGKPLSSLKIESSIIKDDKEINPNIKRKITSEKLIEKMGESDYIGFSTKDTNIPEGASYTVYVNSDEDTFMLFYDKGGVITNRTLRNENGKIEFSIEKDVDYALVSKSQSPKTEIKGFSVLIPILIVIILLIAFTIIYRRKMPEIMRKTYKKEENNNTGK